MNAGAYQGATGQTEGVCADPEPGPDVGRRWLSPIGDRRWTGADGTRWRMRGGVLTRRAVGRLLKRPDVRVLHVYGPEPAEIEREAAEFGITLQAHYAHMLVHGTLHAQGFDHEEDEEARTMEARETALMQSLGFADPYSR